VGLNDNAEAVTNMFVPFLHPEERYMPFLKPRFRINDTGLKRITYPVGKQADETEWATLLEFLRKNDRSFWRFESYRLFGITPIASLLRKAYLWIHECFLAASDHRKGLAIQARIISEFQRVAAMEGTHVIFLTFVDTKRDNRPLYKRLLYNPDEMYLSMLRGTKADIMFVADVLERTNRPLHDFYIDDGIHFTPEANEVIGNAIRNRISELALPTVRTAGK
jgi:hypothetical protein